MYTKIKVRHFINLNKEEVEVVLIKNLIIYFLTMIF